MADLPGIHESERSLIAWGYSYKLGETRNLPEGYGLSELFLAALDIHLTTWESTQQKIPFFKGLFFTRLFGGAKQLIRRGSFSGFRGVLLDRIQLRFLYRMRNSSHKQCVRWVDSALLWAHCREWICATSAYAAKVAELRLK